VTFVTGCKLKIVEARGLRAMHSIVEYLKLDEIGNEARVGPYKHDKYIVGWLSRASTEVCIARDEQAKGRTTNTN
jgi:hypothetical protein